MESGRQQIENFRKYMKEVKGMETINMLKDNPKALQDVVKWIVENEHDKKFKKCHANLSDKCKGIGPASKFHGKRCIDCSREYHRTHYSHKHTEVYRTRKNGAKPSKRSDTDDESSESECEKPKKRKRISNKRG